MKKITMKKTVLAIAMLGGIGVTSFTHASVVTDVNVYKGDGVTLIAPNVHEFDWNSSGQGVAKGVLGAPLFVGQTFDFLYQANLVAFNDASSNPIASPPVLAGLNSTFASGGYEFTVAANVHEQVLASSSLPNHADFGVVGGTYSIFYDDIAAGGTKAGAIPGTGFDDGIEILRFTATGGTSNFSLPTLSGGTHFDFNLIGAFDFINSSFIKGILGDVIDLHFTSSQVTPISITPAGFHMGGSAFYPNYVQNANDLLMKVDGSNNFTVPEPGSMLLLAIGLAGLGFNLARRRSCDTSRKIGVSNTMLRYS